MLSLHEAAALMVLKQVSHHFQPDRADLEALQAQQLIAIETLPCGQTRFEITNHGSNVLRSITTLR